MLTQGPFGSTRSPFHLHCPFIICILQHWISIVLLMVPDFYFTRTTIFTIEKQWPSLLDQKRKKKYTLFHVFDKPRSLLFPFWRTCSFSYTVFEPRGIFYTFRHKHYELYELQNFRVQTHQKSFRLFKMATLITFQSLATLTVLFWSCLQMTGSHTTS